MPDPTPPSPAQRPTGQVDLDEVRRRVEAATPGPWEHDPEGYMDCGSVWCASTDDSLFGGPIAEPSGDCYPRGGYDPKADMVFIAHARTDIPALLADLDAAREALRRVEAALEQTQRDAKTGWQLYRSEQADHNALKAAADKLAERAEDADEAEAEVERMRPVVEKARTLVGCWREEPVVADTDWISDEAQALTAAVDTYETQEGTE